MSAASEIVHSPDVPPAWMQMASGKGIDLLRPSPDVVDFNDIATHLSRLCRFTGAASTSVALHSVVVSMLCPPHLRLHGLLHDAHEAYFGDDSTPKKNAIYAVSPAAAEVLADLKHRWDEAIWEAAGVNPPTDDERAAIKAADHLSLAIERRDCMAAPADEMTGKAWEWLPTPPPNIRLGELSAERSCAVFLNCLAGEIWPSHWLGVS
jgi:hypothetical protein